MAYRLVRETTIGTDPISKLRLQFRAKAEAIIGNRSDVRGEMERIVNQISDGEITTVEDAVIALKLWKDR